MHPGLTSNLTAPADTTQRRLTAHRGRPEGWLSGAVTEGVSDAVVHRCSTYLAVPMTSTCVSYLPSAVATPPEPRRPLLGQDPSSRPGRDARLIGDAPSGRCSARPSAHDTHLITGLKATTRARTPDSRPRKPCCRHPGSPPCRAHIGSLPSPWPLGEPTAPSLDRPEARAGRTIPAESVAPRSEGSPWWRWLIRGSAGRAL